MLLITLVEGVALLIGHSVMQVDGLNNGNGASPSGATQDGAVTPSGNLAEQAVGAALRYRAYAPVLDKLLQEVGLSQNGVAGLVAAAQSKAAPNGSA